MFQVVETIANSLNQPVRVCFQPWADEFALGPGELFRVIAVSRQDGKLEVVDAGS